MSRRHELAGLRAQAMGVVANPAVDIVMAEHVIEFATSSRFLGYELFPVQGLLLKIVTLAVHLFTDFDLAFLEQCNNYTLSADGAHYEGTVGVSPDLMVRETFVATEVGHHSARS